MDQGRYNWQLAFACFVALLPFYCCYNLETRLPIFKYGPEGSKFGFSVAQHRTTTDPTSGVGGTLLVTGAPTAYSLPSQNTGQTPRNPGGVFYCPVTTDPLDCTRVLMDAGGNSRDPRNGVYSIKSNQWLGASLKSQGPGKYLVACAHRFTQHVNPGSVREVERMCGKCFLLNATSSERIDEVPADSPSLPREFLSNPCRKFSLAARSTKRFYGYPQAGISIDLRNQSVVLGAPGTWAWSGAIFDINMDDDVETAMYESPTCFAREKTSSSKCDYIPLRRDGYMGFSVAASDAVDTDSDEMYYAAGAPRGNDTGAVIFFKKGTVGGSAVKLVPDLGKSVVGDKIGSSFGFSVALTDINGDDLDDLIVGSPQYYEYSNKRKAGGAVYIFINSPDKEFGDIVPQRIYGKLDSFFGHSIAALGDIDQDGFNDFAVGAPYEKQNGTVHIFRGTSSGVVSESQVIEGKKYTSARRDFREIVGFGASLSGAVDADGNKYPDLLIGTFSDKIVLLRSRPIISVEMSLSVGAEEIDLEAKPCTSRGRPYSCFTLSFCFSYTTRHEEYPEEVPIKYTLTLDKALQDKGEKARVHFDSPRGDAVVKRKDKIPRAGQGSCPGPNHEIYFDNGVDDKLSDIGIKLEIELDVPKLNAEKEPKDVLKMIEDPILDADLESVKTALVRVKNSCGKDGCQSDLKIEAAMPDEVVIGQDDTLPLQITVSNEGEEAHQAHITINLPPNVDFVAVETKDPSAPIIPCYSASSGDSSFIKCDIGNPYKEGAKSELVMRLSLYRLSPRAENIDITIQGHTTSANPEILPVALRSRVMVELDVSLTVSADPEQVRYEEKEIRGESGMETTSDIGTPIRYTFNINNEGPQPATGISLNVELPIEISNGKWLLYLVSSDVQTGVDIPMGRCNSTYFNVLQIQPSEAKSAAIYSRSKRSADSSKVVPEAEASSTGGFVSKYDLDCDNNNARCINLACQIDEVAPSSTTSVVVQTHLWEATFLEEFKHVDLVHVKTHVKLTAEEENIRFKGDNTQAEIVTTVDHEVFKSDVTSAFPWWYILIGVILLLLVYIVIIVLLIKCGFFRRKKFPRQEDDDDKAVLEEDDRKEDDEL